MKQTQSERRLKRGTRPRHPAQGARPAATSELRELDIGVIGARGDAVTADAHPIYVPFALPQERVRARVTGERAEVVEILSPSPDRRAPLCRHFGRCGGCQLQHWDEAPYLAWKRDRVIEALAKRGLGCEVEATMPAWGEGRRRAVLHAARLRGETRIGFIERGGARLLPTEQCPALSPALEAAMLKLAPIAELFAPARGEITLACLEADTGVDVAIKGAGRVETLGRETLEAAATAAERAGLVRLSINGEPIVRRAPPILRMGAAHVTPPPGAFLQPTARGEEILAELTLSALQGAERIVDLFSGVGTFALRLAAGTEVLAVEADAEMLAALKRAADGAAGALKQVSILRRDLLRTPLSNLEMKKFDAAVIDPPRSGARLQVEQIARSRIRKLAYVSCDAPSFARDLRILADHGFSLTRLTPVDQFRWSPHLELVGALER